MEQINIESFVRGLVAGNSDSAINYWDKLFSCHEFTQWPLPNDESRRPLADLVRRFCYKGDLEQFIDSLVNATNPTLDQPGARDVLESAWRLSFDRVCSESDVKEPKKGFGLLCTIITYSGIALEGKARSALRSFVQNLPLDVGDALGRAIPDSVVQQDLRNATAGAIFDREEIGAWRVWLMVSHSFLSNDLDEAEEAANKSLRVAELAALLKGSWNHPIIVGSPTSARAIEHEREWFDELKRLDLEAAMKLIDEAPNDRRAEPI